MTEGLSKAKIQLEDYSKNLEKKVEERTSEIKQKDKQLEEANKELKALDMKKDEFISVAAHELKTPLTSIRGFSQLMQNEKVMEDKEKRKHYLDLINKNTDRLYNLVLDVVDISRISIGKIAINLSEIDVQVLFNEIKENMELIIREKGVLPEFSIERDLPKIEADYARTLQILRNLIINAVNYTEKGGIISVTIHRNADFVQFEVKDTGYGIPEENKKYIFSRFYQVDSSLTRKVGGSGLGLSICQGLVELMKGTIWFESEEGKGTTFYFTLPIKK